MKLYSYKTIFCVLALVISISFMTSCAREKPVVESTATDDESDMANAGDAPSSLLDSGESPEPPKGPTYKNLVDGKDISLEAMKAEGYVLIVDFWATWCPPCRMEIPEFIELQNKYRGRKFAVIGVSMDKGGEAVVRQFVDQNGINYPVIMNTREIQKEYELAIGQPIRSIPTTFVVDRQGGIASVHVGYTSKAVFEREIQELFRQPALLGMKN
jgi:thiol-disulfide isomerase/thioredoxin